jgi:hypothetical protein
MQVRGKVYCCLAAIFPIPLPLLLLTDLQCPPALEEPPEGKEIPLKGGLRGELVPSPLQSFLLHPLSRIGEGGMKGGTEEK